MDETQHQLLGQIARAFDGVELGDGVSLCEAAYRRASSDGAKRS